MADILVANPGAGNDIRANWNTAETSASDGDTLVLPAGTFQVTEKLKNTSSGGVGKRISVKGAGMASTILIRDESVADATLESGTWKNLMEITVGSNNPSGMTFSDFTLRSKNPSIVTGDGGSMAGDVGLKLINCVDYKIRNCKFMYFGDSGLEIRHRDYISRGLIYNNEFFRNKKGSLGLGLGYGISVYGEDLYWQSIPPMFGSSNWLFIEDNIFDHHRHSIASAKCAMYVVRNNTCRFNMLTTGVSHCIDMHESDGVGNSNVHGTRAIEVYNNTLVNTTQKDGVTPLANGVSSSQIEERCIGINNGAAVVHGNIVSGYRFMLGVRQTITGGPYPRPEQLGGASAAKRGALNVGTDPISTEDHLYFWGNTFTPYTLASGSSAEFYNYDDPTTENGTYLKNLREYSKNVIKPGYSAYTYPHPLR